MKGVLISLSLAIPIVCLAFAAASTRVTRETAPVISPRVSSPGNLYDPQADHIWNRVDRELRIRTASDGRAYGTDAVDPLLWRETNHLLTGTSHSAALALLDEFLASDADRLVTDPVRRAIFQRDVWAVFDWVVARTDVSNDERGALASRLARIIRRVALTSEQITALPNTYTATVTSARYPTRYEPATRQKAFLPTGLFDASGPWVAIHGTVPVAQHADELSRSDFAVFISLPGGRAATRTHLRQLWDAPEPFVVDPGGSFGGETRTTLNPALRPLPAGTTIALVRRMLLIDRTGESHVSPLVESIQMRVFRDAEPCRSVRCGHNDQEFYEFILSRAGLFASPSHGLRAVEPQDESFLTFSSQGIDAFEGQSRFIGRANRTLDMCVNCHSEPGLASVLTARRLFKPFTFAQGGGPGGDGMPAFWKSQRADWGQLQALWRILPQ